MVQLTPEQAFAALTLFVNQFADRAGNDLLTLIGDIQLDDQGHTFDPAAWDDWMECVRQVVEREASSPA